MFPIISANIEQEGFDPSQIQKTVEANTNFILYEGADSYVPSFYKGRRLPAKEGLVRAAFFSFKDGEIVGLNNPTPDNYTWRVNGEDRKDLSGDNKIINNVLAGYIALSDEIRPESAEAIATLKKENIKSILLTGDNGKVAASVSKTLGMDSFIAEVLPHQKLEKIKELQSKGEFVAMTGDGVNDAPALAQADVGIAVGSGSDIAAETAGIVLVNSNPKDIVSLILFGKATYCKMIQNLIWATGYNVIALPLAAGVLYKQGILLSPAAGAALMTVSTIVVAINASRLKVKN